MPKTRMGKQGLRGKTSNSCNARDEKEHPIYDSAENYMMYTSDACQTNFTNGQM